MKKKFRIAAVGDIHVHVDSQNAYHALFEDISKNADVLLLCGDLTDTGLTDEAEVLAQELKACTIPVICVLGNHDHENNLQDEIKTIIASDNVTILDGDSKIIDDIGFVGLKGFGGGFGKYMLSAWGEQSVKNFVNETVTDVLRLEKALHRLDTKHKVILLHYSPIRPTVVGEPEEIFPYLGSSRLADPINRFGADVVFHGHAHRGTHEGKTSKDIPVFNVSHAIMQTINPEHPYKLFEI